jgi:hypothetical protein
MEGISRILLLCSLFLMAACRTISCRSCRLSSRDAFSDLKDTQTVSGHLIMFTRLMMTFSPTAFAIEFIGTAYTRTRARTKTCNLCVETFFKFFWSVSHLTSFTFFQMIKLTPSSIWH